MSFKDKIIKDRLPQHVAIIMDGNGRWAKQRNKHRIIGHQNGVEAVRNTIEAAGELNIPYITLYAFSTENWNRPEDEVLGIMTLLVDVIEHEMPGFMKNNIRLKTIGNIDAMPEKVQERLNAAINETAKNTGLTLILALSYSSQWEIINGVKSIARKVKDGEINVDDINNDLFTNHLNTAGIPNPELMIRTSGEFRISNFLLWQLAYAELYFTSILWPDFSKEEFYKALVDYQSRERRFGKTSEQLKQ